MQITSLVRRLDSLAIKIAQVFVGCLLVVTVSSAGVTSVPLPALYVGLNNGSIYYSNNVVSKYPIIIILLDRFIFLCSSNIHWQNNVYLNKIHSIIVYMICNMNNV